MIKKFFIFILATFVIFEEWLWDVLAIAGQQLSRLLHLEKFDTWLINASPNQALFSFAIPLIVVTPFNILAIMLLAHGAIIEGILLEIVIKLSGTLLIARIFRLVKPALLTFNWFASIYNRISTVLKWAKALVKNTQLYQLSVELKAEIKQKMAGWLKHD